MEFLRLVSRSLSPPSIHLFDAANVSQVNWYRNRRENWEDERS